MTISDQVRYSAQRIAHFRAHWLAYETAVLNPGHESSARQVQRLDEECRHLPRGHVCTCRPQDCPSYGALGRGCVACLALHASRPVGADQGAELAHRSVMVHSPTPDVMYLDIQRALAAGVGRWGSQWDQARSIARWLSDGGV